MPREAKVLAGLLTLLLVIGLLGLGYCHRSRELREQSAANRKMASDLQLQQALAASNQLQIADGQSALLASRQRVESLQRENEELLREKVSLDAARQSLEKEMRQALESKDVTISELQGKLMVNILDRVLFDSGEAVIKPGGEEVLRRAAEVLRQHPDQSIQVVGHTDNVPIKAASRSRYASNWELSTARATAAVRFLCEQAGVEPQRLGAVGYAEFRPLADNATPEGRARNRRIALIVVGDKALDVEVEQVPAASVETALPAAGVSSTNGVTLPQPP